MATFYEFFNEQKYADAVKNVSVTPLKAQFLPYTMVIPRTCLSTLTDAGMPALKFTIGSPQSLMWRLTLSFLCQRPSIKLLPVAMIKMNHSQLGVGERVY